MNYKSKTKGTVGSVQRLLFRYCQLPDKNSRDISIDTWKFFRYFRIYVYFFDDFSHNPKVLRVLGWETLVQIISRNSIRYVPRA